MWSTRLALALALAVAAVPATTTSAAPSAELEVSRTLSADGFTCDAPMAPGTRPIARAADQVTRILYVNRCRGGCTVSPGPDDASKNTSTLIEGEAVTLAEFPYGDQAWADMMVCLHEMFAPFNINVTDVDPGDQPHFETLVAGQNSDLGQSGAAGVAPSGCAGVDRAISYAFAEDIADSGRALCEVVAHEAGHTFGLEHAYLCEDPMTYLEGCGPKSFQDIEADCGTGGPEACTCGDTQNSFRHLLEVFGPGGQPATVDLSIEALSEDPSASNGDGIIEPGEQVLAEVIVHNGGNQVATGATIDVVSSGVAKPADPSLPDVPAGFAIRHQVSAEVLPDACGQLTDVEVVARLDGQSYSATGSILPGVSRSDRTELFADAAGWIADGASANQGGFEFGVPGETIFAGRTLQSAGGGGGPGDAAWMTGLMGDWDESPLAGETTLTSTTMDLASWHTVTAIRLNLWYLAFDRPNRGLEPSAAPHLFVELSADDGTTWVPAAEVASDPLRWEEIEVPVELPEDFALSETTRVRLVAKNDAAIEDRLVEIGVDSVTLVGGALTCTPSASSGGCATIEAPAGSRLPLLLTMMVMALAALRRRHRSSAAR